MKFCNKCGNKLEENNKFCKKCGEKLKEKTLDHPHKPGASGTEKFFIIGIIVFMAAIFFLAVPTRSATYQVEVPYQDTETYTETEPYTAQEPYERQEAYEDTVPYDKQEAYASTESYTDTVKTTYESAMDNCDYNANCQCTSTSFWSGICVKCVCVKVDYVQKTRPVTKYKTVTDYQTVTKYRTVTDYQTVTKYRDVQKTRPVMKTRMEDRTKEVNWLFGFEIPWALHII